MTRDARPALLVLASTYPRWENDHEPGFVHELAKRLGGDFRVLALVPSAPGALGRETLDGVDVIRYRYAPRAWETLVNDGGIVTNLRRARWMALLVPTFVLAQAWAVWRLLRTEQVDVIHAHWLLPQGLVVALLRNLPGCRVPFVVTSHGADLYALRGGIMDALKRFVLRRASFATVVSRAMSERLLAMGVDRERVLVRPMGVDLAERFTCGRELARSSNRLLFVGRLVEKKGLRHLLDAMPHVLEKAPDTVLLIAGFGPEDAALRSQVRTLGIGASVEFLGAVAQANLPSLYRDAALFIAPFVQAASGDEEGLGLVLLEAIGCGCPVLAGDVPALDEILGGEFGELRVTPGDPQDFARRILETLSHPEDARGAAMRLRQVLADRLDWRPVSRGYAQLLREAAAGAKR